MLTAVTICQGHTTAELYSSNQNTARAEWIDRIMAETLAKDSTSTLQQNKHTIEMWSMPSVWIIYESEWVVNATLFLTLSQVQWKGHINQCS